MKIADAQQASRNWRNRITGHRQEAPEQLLAHPRNWRVHPKAQQDALAAVLDQVGWVQDVIVNQRTGHVVDDHARIALAITRQEPTIPVVYVDLDEAEEKLILASLDPLSAMATTDAEAMRELLAEITGDDESRSRCSRRSRLAGRTAATPTQTPSSRHLSRATCSAARLRPRAAPADVR